VQFPIPGNDDAIRAITLYARVVADAIGEGRSARTEGAEVTVEVQADAPEAAKPTKVTLDDVASDKSEQATGQ